MKVKTNLFTVIFFLMLAVSCKDSVSPSEKIGLKDPLFQYLSKDWIPQYNKMSMSQIWQSEGINREGYNYYFFPAPVSPYTCSARFIPSSDYFQCWFGIYTVSDNTDGVFALKNDDIDETEILKLAIADQRAWLKNFAGLTVPVLQIDTNVQVTKEKIFIDSQNGWKISGRLISNADVGENNNKSVPDLLKIKKEYWEKMLESYQQIYLDVFAYIWYAPENNELNVAYFNGVEFTAKDGTTYRTTEKVFSELEKMTYKITVYQ